MKKTLLRNYCLFAFLLPQYGVFCQKSPDFTFPNGAKAAICLTYDDGLSSHVNTVAPVLDKHGLKGTFFVTVSATSVREEMDKWKALATTGHELANHSVYHPCRKSLAGMDWVLDYRDLDHYTIDQVLAEIQVANGFLQALDGKRMRTYAYPCAHHFAGGISFKDSVAQVSSAARGVHDNLLPPSDIDLFNVSAFAPSDVEGKDLIAFVQSVIEKQTLSTFCFHGVGAEYLSVSTAAHEELLQWLADHRGEVWVATFGEATDYIRKEREK